MFDIPGPLGTLFNFLVIALGFGSIIFVHELGHFVAAKWAGIRVLAFSIGFGQVACSFRKGMGFQAGSSEPEYMRLVREQDGDHTKLDMSPTEYRLSWLPLGGYVKMLGQEDLNPHAVSSASDSYQNCPIPKRLVVISAGVIVNLITAALLFIVVFSVGLKIMPPTIGQIYPASPAAIATPVDSQYAIGLQPGDTVLSVNGKQVRAFRDIATEAAMSSPSKPASIIVERDGFDSPIEYQANLKPGGQLNLLDLGITSVTSATLLRTNKIDEWKAAVEQFSLSDIPPGSTITSINGDPVAIFSDIQGLLKNISTSAQIGYTTESGENGFISIIPQTRFMSKLVELDDDSSIMHLHILGLTGLMQVDPDAKAKDIDQGLMPGDIFVRIGSQNYPSQAQAIKTIRSNAGHPIELTVLRKTDDTNERKSVELLVQVKDTGTIGFTQISTMRSLTYVADASDSFIPIPSGSQVVSVNGEPVENLNQLAIELLHVIHSEQESDGMPIEIHYLSPDSQAHKAESIQITLSADEVQQLEALGYQWPGGENVRYTFQPVQIIDQSDGPIAAVKRGVHESRRVMLQTYLTFLRLTQGTVKVEHLKGPVGIAHIGTQLADEGFIKVLFFMALISINLAVINFLPLPIVDGGQFLFLLYEGIRGKPIPIVVQNAVTMAGLALIGTMFLLVTFNDIKSLIGF